MALQAEVSWTGAFQRKELRHLRVALKVATANQDDGGQGQGGRSGFVWEVPIFLWSRATRHQGVGGAGGGQRPTTRPVALTDSTTSLRWIYSVDTRVLQGTSGRDERERHQQQRRQPGRCAPTSRRHGFRHQQAQALPHCRDYQQQAENRLEAEAGGRMPQRRPPAGLMAIWACTAQLRFSTTAPAPRAEPCHGDGRAPSAITRCAA